MIDNDEEHINVDLDEANVSEEDVLMFSTYSGPRVFILNDERKTNILGLVLDESDDSFLVGMPGKALQDAEGNYKIEPFVPVPYLRFLKSGILSLMYVPEPVSTIYQTYLEEKGPEIYPDIADHIEDVEADDLEEQTPGQAIVAPNEVNVSLTPDEQGGNKVLGMTDEELRKYLTDKYNNGELIGGSNKKQ